MEKDRWSLFQDRWPTLDLSAGRQGFTTEIKDSFPGLEVVDIRYSYDDEWVASKIVEELLEIYPELTGIYITGHGVKGVCQTLKKLEKTAPYM